MGEEYSTQERLEMHTKFWSENLKGSNHLEDLGLDWRKIRKLVLEK
jgi:hypothetical protein